MDRKGRLFKLEYEDEVLEAKKRDDIVVSLRNCPKIIEHLTEKLRNSDCDSVFNKEDNDLDNSELDDDILDNPNDEGAEEIETNDWGNL